MKGKRLLIHPAAEKMNLKEGKNLPLTMERVNGWFNVYYNGGLLFENLEEEEAKKLEAMTAEEFVELIIESFDEK